MRKSFISDPKKAGKQLPNKSANKRVLSELRKDGIGHYLQGTEGRKQRQCAICIINEGKNAVIATLVCTLNAWQHGMNDS